MPIREDFCKSTKGMRHNKYSANLNSTLYLQFLISTNMSERNLHFSKTATGNMSVAINAKGLECKTQYINFVGPYFYFHFFMGPYFFGIFFYGATKKYKSIFDFFMDPENFI